MIKDQITGQFRLPFQAFEPRLPANRPNATQYDKYLSVNIASSLRNAGLPLDWDCDPANYYAGVLSVESIADQYLTVTWEPVPPTEADSFGRPHHGAINGVVELHGTDRYDRVLDALAKASTVLAKYVPGNDG